MAKRKVRNPPRKVTTAQQVVNDAPVPPVSQGHIDPQLQEHIGRQLQALYNEVLEEPVPERFLTLLSELERKRDQQP